MKTFLRRLLALLRPDSGREQLSYLLEAADPEASLEERVLWLERLIHWIKTSPGLPEVITDGSGRLQVVRLRFIIHLLQKNPVWKEKTAAALRSILLDTDAVDLFCQAGLARERGFAFEAFDRVLQRALPSPPRYHNAAELFQRMFDDRADADLIEHLPPELTLRLAELIRFERRGGAEADMSAISSRATRAMVEALAILGAQISAIGTGVEIRRRLPDASASNSPFLRLNEKILDVVEAFREDGALSPRAAAELRSARAFIEDGRKAVEQVFRHLEKSGVSVGLVYLLERQLSALSRAETLMGFMASGSARETHRLASSFLASVIREQADRRSIRGLFRSSLHLLSRKISERSGVSGEHYITHTREEYFDMLRAAAGGGAVTVGTALGKFMVAAMGAPLFFDGLLTSIVYAGSFLLMQALGFALATKQPSMTAAAIAGKLDDVDREEGVKAFVTEVACLTRSQAAAAIGNLGVAVPASILFDQLFKLAFGRSVLSLEYAQYLWDAHHPLYSLSIWYGALTGVLLFLSSMAAGWLENFVVLHEIPEAIAQNRGLRRVFGDAAPRRLADAVLRQTAGVGGNVSVGFLLGGTHVFGRFFGAPLEVRHLTLSSATLAFSLSSLSEAGLSAGQVLWPVLALLLIGALNFGVSFSLALFVAVRARNVEAEALIRIAREIRRRFRLSPLEYFYARR